MTKYQCPIVNIMIMITADRIFMSRYFVLLVTFYELFIII